MTDRQSVYSETFILNHRNYPLTFINLFDKLFI